MDTATYKKRVSYYSAGGLEYQLFPGLLAFHRDVGRFPTNEEGLDSLNNRPSGLASWRGPYFEKSTVVNGFVNDRLDSPLHFESFDNGKSVVVGMVGLDQIKGTKDDVYARIERFDDASDSVSVDPVAQSVIELCKRENFGQALAKYYRDVGAFPETSINLTEVGARMNIAKWNGPYLTKGELDHAVGRKFGKLSYRSIEVRPDAGFTILVPGPDRQGLDDKIAIFRPQDVQLGFLRNESGKLDVYITTRFIGPLDSSATAKKADEK